MLLSCAFVPASPFLLPGLISEPDAQVEKTIAVLQALARDMATLRPKTIVVIGDGDHAHEQTFSLDLADPYKVDFSDFGHLGATTTYRPNVAIIDRLQRQAREEHIPFTLDTRTHIAPHCAVMLEFFKQRLPQVSLVPLYVATDANLKEHVRCGELLRHVLEDSNDRVVVIATSDVMPEALVQFENILKERQLAQLIHVGNALSDSPQALGVRQLAVLFGVLNGTDVRGNILCATTLFQETGCLVAEFPLR